MQVHPDLQDSHTHVVGDKYLSKKFWQDQSDNLMYKGKTNGLSDTKKARMPAFFEHSNVNLPQYS